MSDDLDGDIAEVARRHGVLLDRDDPVLIERTLAERRIAPLVTRFETSIDAVADVPGETADRVTAAMRPFMETAAASCRIMEQVADRPILTNAQVSTHLVPAIAQALKVRTLTYATGIMLVAMLASGSVGYWRGYLSGNAAGAEIGQTATAQLANLPPDAARVWTQLIASNSGIVKEMQACNPLPSGTGQACLLPVWTMPPTPGVH